MFDILQVRGELEFSADKLVTELYSREQPEGIMGNLIIKLPGITTDFLCILFFSSSCIYFS